MKIFAYNPKLEDIEKTFLSNSTVVGATTFKVKNTDRFEDERPVLVGEMSRERSEVLYIDSLTATQLTLGAAVFPHDADDPVYAIKFDKVRIYRSTTGEDGVYSLLDTVDIDVDNADGKTWYEDPNSLDTYYYKVSYYDSIGDEETEQSDAIKATGYERDQVGSIILQVATKIGDKEFLDIDAQEHLDNANDISDDLLTQAKRPYRFLKRMEQLDIEADASTVDFPTTFWKVNYVEVNEVAPASSRTYRPKKVSATEARFQLTMQTTPGDYVSEIAFDDEENQMIVVPKARTQRLNAFNFHFYKEFDTFTSFSSRIEGPTRLVYKLGLLRDAYMTKADSDDKYLKKAMEYDRKYNAEVIKLQREKNIEAGGPDGLAPDKKRYPQWGGRRYRQ